MGAIEKRIDTHAVLQDEKITCAVKWFNLKKGYGFLSHPYNEETDIFMHFSLLEEAGYQHVSENDEVVCDIGNGRNGAQVIKIYHVKHAHFSECDLNRIPLVLEEKSGIVKWFNVLRGYGFIEPDDGGRDIFMHTGSLKGIGVDRLLRGQRVSAKILITERGQEARDITLLDSAT